MRNIRASLWERISGNILRLNYFINHRCWRSRGCLRLPSDSLTSSISDESSSHLTVFQPNAITVISLWRECCARFDTPRNHTFSYPFKAKYSLFDLLAELFCMIWSSVVVWKVSFNNISFIQNVYNAWRVKVKFTVFDYGNGRSGWMAQDS